jgi:hypothetical protein
MLSLQFMAKLNIRIFFAVFIIKPECVAMAVHLGTLETGSRVHYRISVQSGATGGSLTRSVRKNPSRSRFCLDSSRLIGSIHW